MYFLSFFELCLLVSFDLFVSYLLACLLTIVCWSLLWVCMFGSAVAQTSLNNTDALCIRRSGDDVCGDDNSCTVAVFPSLIRLVFWWPLSLPTETDTEAKTQNMNDFELNHKNHFQYSTLTVFTVKNYITITCCILHPPVTLGSLFSISAFSSAQSSLTEGNYKTLRIFI